MDTKNLIVRVIDSQGGLFLPIAQRIARDVKLCEYWTPAWEAMPTVRCNSVGDGFPDIERVEYPFSMKNTPDLFVFPDLDFAEMQADAVGRGFAVWGNRNAEELENKRGLFLQVLEDIGLPAPHHKTIRGMAALMDYLKEHDDQYIKVSKYRGDFETMHWRSWELDKSELFRRAVKLGPFGDQMTFYVFEPIDAIVEDGVDTFSVVGQWPQTCLHGIEKKNTGYLCTVAQMKDLPEELREVNEKMGPVLEEYDARGFFSTEVRITEDGPAYFIDPTIRAGIPPSQVQTEMFSNYTDILWGGANGELVEPEPVAEFGCQVLLHSKQGKDDWKIIKVPKELKQWVKCPAACEIDGRLCLPPTPEEHGSDIGWLVATGNSIRSLVTTLLAHIDALPDGVEADPYAVADLIKEVHDAEAAGMEFTEQPVPDPAVVLDEK